MPPSTRQSAAAPAGFFSSPRNQRRLFIVSAGVLAIGVVAFVATFILRGTGNASPDKFSNKNAQLASKDKKEPFSQTEEQIARKFVETAVLRKNVASSFDIVDVDLKGRMTRNDWAKGNLPVIPYPADNAKTAHFEVDYSYQKSALLEVELVAKPGSPSSVKPQLLFFLGLKREHGKANGKWLVSYWEPHWRPPIPQQQ